MTGIPDPPKVPMNQARPVAVILAPVLLRGARSAIARPPYT